MTSAFTFSVLECSIQSEVKQIAYSTERCTFSWYYKWENAVLASDDGYVPEYLVNHDNKPELQMIDAADNSKIPRRRVFGELEALKERLWKVASLPLKRNCSVRVLVTNFAMQI